MNEHKKPWLRFFEAALASQHAMIYGATGAAPFGSTPEEWENLSSHERRIASLAWHLRPEMGIPRFGNQPIVRLLSEVTPEVAAMWLRFAETVEESQRRF